MVPKSWQIGLGATAVAGIVLYLKIEHINAKIFDTLVKVINNDSGTEKKILFEKINQLAKNSGEQKLKILEIGGGTGANFEFITQSVNWTAIDPNPYCLDYYNAKIKDLGDIHNFERALKVSIFKKA